MGSFNKGSITNTCAFKQRRAGVLIPQCPPADELQINGAADFWFWEQASQERKKATYDYIINSGKPISKNIVSGRITMKRERRVTTQGDFRAVVERK